MLAEWLRKRCPSACPIGTATAPGYYLCFKKRSVDGSGKATLVRCEEIGQEARGVLFEIAEDERDNLDRAEGKGYWRNDDFAVLCSDHANQLSVSAYLAEKCEDGLVPYDWYRALVLAGAIQHQFPEQYVKELRRVVIASDPDPNRKERQEALRILGCAGFAYLLEVGT